jgi:uncharacterized membrane protein YcaP (DUF421 family)
MTTRPPFVAMLRWTARGIGTLIILLIAVLAVGEGVPNPLHQPTVVNFSFVALLVMLAGQVTAWWREGTGGALVLGGMAAFAVANHGVKLNAVFAPMLVTGVFYLLCGWLARRKS